MLDWLLHALGGGVIVAVAWFLLGSTVVGVYAATIFGVARESYQRGWLPPWYFSNHAWSEGLAWGVGAAIAAGFLGGLNAIGIV